MSNRNFFDIVLMLFEYRIDVVVLSLLDHNRTRLILSKCRADVFDVTLMLLSCRLVLVEVSLM